MQNLIPLLLNIYYKATAHELGHSLGMNHDFGPPYETRVCDKKGFMSYEDFPMKWSNCSRADFEAHYLQHKDHWCLQSRKLKQNTILDSALHFLICRYM